ncbi:MAG: heterodisulfide reductase subunit B [Proteobacteria bacterium]|nr:heterodisulfide reductase subunit B [Pseudomonadota bacterium]
MAIKKEDRWVMAENYAYYPGCSLHSTGSEFDISFRAVCGKLGVELREIEDWICCGSSSAHSTSKLLSMALPIQNLCLAEKMEMSEVVAPCSSCFARLRTALQETAEDAELGRKISEIVDAPLPKDVKVMHPLEIFGDGAKAAGAVKKELPHLKVVCSYGCLLTRPSRVMQFDQCEYPMSMDNLLDSIGITTLDWSYKTDCCGGAFSLTETDIALKLTNDILEEAKAVGANAIAVACPLCHANLDTRQAEIERKYNVRYGLPILYFTQIMGLVLGIPANELGIQKHFVNADKLLSGNTE